MPSLEHDLLNLRSALSKDSYLSLLRQPLISTLPPNDRPVSFSIILMIHTTVKTNLADDKIYRVCPSHKSALRPSCLPGRRKRVRRHKPAPAPYPAQRHGNHDSALELAVDLDRESQWRRPQFLQGRTAARRPIRQWASAYRYAATSPRPNAARRG